MNRGLIHVAQRAICLDYSRQINDEVVPLNFPNRGLNMVVGVVCVSVLDVVLLVEMPQ